MTLYEHGPATRYQVYTLTRLFAAEAALEREPVEVRAAWHTRVMAWWRGLIREATHQLPVTFNGVGSLPEAAVEPAAEMVEAVKREPARWLTEAFGPMLHQVDSSLDSIPSDLCWPALAEAQTWWQTAGPSPGAEAVLDKALERCEAQGDKLGVATMLVMTAVFALSLADPDEAIRRLERAREYFLETGDLGGQVCTAHEIAAQVSRRAYYSDDIELQRVALGLIRIGCALATEFGDLDRLVDAETARATAAVGAGELAEAREATDHARELLEGTGKIQAVAHIDWLLAMVLSREGDYIGARDLLISSGEVLGASGYVWGLARVQLELGRTLLMLGDRDGAARQFRRCARNAEGFGHVKLQREAEEGLTAAREAGS